MASTIAETIKKLSLTSFTMERQTVDKYSHQILSPVYEGCIAKFLCDHGFSSIFSWSIKLQKSPIKEIGMYTVKVSLSSDPKEDVEIKLWVVSTPYETKEKPKPPVFSKYYIQKNGLTTRKFYRVDSEWSAIHKGYNAVWVDAQGKEHQCCVYSRDYKVLEEVSKDKAMSLIGKPVVLPIQKQGISIKEAVRQLEAEGKIYVTYGCGRMPLFDNTNAVRVIMGAYKKSTHCRRVSLKEALRWAKNL